MRFGFYKPETCENPYLTEYAAELDKYAERDAIPAILELFPFEIAEYYYCQYFQMRRDPRFEASAIAYLDVHPWVKQRSQRILYDLLNTYLRNDFIKPQKWCAWIAETDGLCGELYMIAAQFYGMIAEYDAADKLLEKLERCCKDGTGVFLFSNGENMLISLEKQKADILRYRTKKPYWSASEERRRAVAMFYDEKGIQHPRIENKPVKIPENEFAPIHECFEDDLDDYCAFWCAGAFSLSATKSIYQIAAVKVRSGEIVDTFSAFVRPWDGGASARKSAAKEAGVTVETIEGAEDVDLVMPKFFEFAGSGVLVSTGALGNQAKLISRAARYAGMKEIKNDFYDLLDLAADTSSDFDLANNTREYLLAHFQIPEGKEALDKAKANHLLYNALKKFGA